MKKRWLIVTAVLALGLFLVALIGGWFEPHYTGIRASSYVLQVLDTPSFNPAIATEKLKAMGAQLAVPALVDALECEDSPLRKWQAIAYGRAPAWLKKRFPAPRSIRHVRANAITALNAFGADAAPAVPALLRIYSRGDPNYRYPVPNLLGAIGPNAREAVPVLFSALTNSGSSYLAIAIVRIDVTGEFRGQAIAWIFEREPAMNRWDLMNSIRFPTPHDDILIPLLTPVLNDPDPRMRGKAAEAFSHLGPVASNAVPQLRPLLNDEWLFVREAATNALRAAEGR